MNLTYRLTVCLPAAILLLGVAGCSSTALPSRETPTTVPSNEMSAANQLLRNALAVESDELALEDVKKAISQGASASLTDEDGYSALMAALARNHLEMSRFLLENGAEVNLRAKDGTTAAYLAVQAHRYSPSLFALVLAYGANVNSTRPDGDPLLSRLVNDSNCEMLQLAHAHGADFSVQDRQGVPLIARAWLAQDWVTTLCMARLGVPLDFEGTNYALSKALALDATAFDSEQFLAKQMVFEIALDAGLPLEPLPSPVFLNGSSLGSALD